MRKLLFFDYLVLGITFFAMSFGSGDVVFSLESGYETSSFIPVTLGFIVASVLFPFMGLVSLFSFFGDYKKFLSLRFGKILAGIVVLSGMLLLGPTGTIPRCVTVAHGALGWRVLPVSSLVFSAIFMIFVYFILDSI